MSELLDALKELIDKGQIVPNHRILFFGANKSSIEMNQYLREHGFSPEGFIDNSEKKQGSLVEGMMVYAPEKALSDYDSNARILIASEYHKQMCEQLGQMGYEKGKEVFVVHTIYSFYDLSEHALNRYLVSADKGKEVYQKLVEQYAGEKKSKTDSMGKNPEEKALNQTDSDKELFIFECPYQGTGDAYLIGTLLQSYIDKHQISSYVITVVSKVCEKIIRMFGFERVATIKKEESDGLVTFLRMMREHIPHLILNDNYQTRIMHRRLRGYRGIDFRHMFQYAVFGLAKEDVLHFPTYQVAESNIRQIMDEHGIIEGKTVILSPYANTISNLPDEVWETIAKKYEEKGFAVFTNSSGDSEPAVKGTKPLFLPYSQMIPVLERAGTFIGMRSGLCDIIASAKCRKIILYPSGCIFGSCTTYQYFSLNAMGLCEDAVEIEFEQGKEEKLITAILSRSMSDKLSDYPRG